MNRVNFANFSGVIVDVCRQHGTWFDRDELRRIVEFIRAGGLDKARAREIQNLEADRRLARTDRFLGGHGLPPMFEDDIRHSAVSAVAQVLFDLLRVKKDEATKNSGPAFGRSLCELHPSSFILHISKSSRMSSQLTASAKVSSPPSNPCVNARLRVCRLRIFSSTVPRVMSL
jgi:Zn-finger nucleic acid-binding protein